MALIPYRPFRDFERWFEEHPFFSPHRFAREFEEEWPVMRTPRVDVYETDGNVVAEFELPGIDPKNIDIEVKNDMVKVEAKAEKKKEEKKKGYYKKELSRGYYKRVVPLPVDVKENQAKASYDNGVLKVTVPKVKSVKKAAKKKIKVKVKTV